MSFNSPMTCPCAPCFQVPCAEAPCVQAPEEVFYLTLVDGGRDDAYWTEDCDVEEAHVLCRMIVTEKTGSVAPTDVLSAEALALPEAVYNKLPYWVLEMERPPTFCHRWGYSDINPLWGYWAPPTNLGMLGNDHSD